MFVHWTKFLYKNKIPLIFFELIQKVALQSCHIMVLNGQMVTMDCPFRNWLFKRGGVRVLKYPLSLNRRLTKSCFCCLLPFFVYSCYKMAIFIEFDIFYEFFRNSNFWVFRGHFKVNSMYFLVGLWLCIRSSVYYARRTRLAGISSHHERTIITPIKT